MAQNRAPIFLPAEALPSLAGESTADVLRLIRANNIGPATFFQLVRRCGNVQEALERLPQLSKQKSKPYDKSLAENEIAQAEKFGARILRYGETDYPTLLLHIPDPPPLLTVFGNAQLWQNRPTIALVGARNASANACHFAQKLARELGARGITIVSGLARGIDTFVHKGSVDTGTVGVIAGGIDHVYPPENASLFQQLRERGAIVSEQPFGQVPFASSFPARNRIISGMCAGVVVVEASVKSGSLITARLALEQGREVSAVPGFPADPRASGCNKLLKDGAHLIENADDVLEAILNQRPMQAEEPAVTLAATREPSETDLADARTQVLEKLGPSPLSIDELLSQCQLTSGLLMSVLLELELTGQVMKQPGNRVSLRIV